MRKKEDVTVFLNMLQIGRVFVNKNMPPNKKGSIKLGPMYLDVKSTDKGLIAKATSIVPIISDVFNFNMLFNKCLLGCCECLAINVVENEVWICYLDYHAVLFLK